MWSVLNSEVLSCICSVDSTVTYGNGIGRFVNDAPSAEANCKLRLLEKDKMPHLVLFAKRDIEVGEELRYDYGVPKLPWRKKVNVT